MRLDFHLHTHLSDGTLEPKALAALVRQQRLKVWSITDHDTCAAYDYVEASPDLICGVEITSAFDGHEIHVLGLGVDRHNPTLVDLLKEIAAIRIQRAECMLEHIGKDFGKTISLESLVPKEALVVTRFHIAQGLRRLGIIANHRQFFSDVMGEERMHSLPLLPYPSVSTVAAAIHAADGVAILAHPSRYAGFDLIEQLMQQDLDGLEVKYPHADDIIEAQLRKLAMRHDYLISCGSDLHWTGRRQPGDFRLSHADAAPLLQRLGWTDPLAT